MSSVNVFQNRHNKRRNKFQQLRRDIIKANRARPHQTKCSTDVHRSNKIPIKFIVVKFYYQFKIYIVGASSTNLSKMFTKFIHSELIESHYFWLSQDQVAPDL